MIFRLMVAKRWDECRAPTSREAGSRVLMAVLLSGAKVSRTGSFCSLPLRSFTVEIIGIPLGMDAQDYPIVHFDRIGQLARALKPLPAQILEHHYSGESFGSWYLVIRHRGVVSLLTYDGRDFQLTIQRSPDRKPPYRYGSEQNLGQGAGFGELDSPAIEEICRVLTL